MRSGRRVVIGDMLRDDLREAIRRRRPESQSSIAKSAGMDRQTLSKIMLRKQGWIHLEKLEPLLRELNLDVSHYTSDEPESWTMPPDFDRISCKGRRRTENFLRWAFWGQDSED